MRTLTLADARETVVTGWCVWRCLNVNYLNEDAATEVNLLDEPLRSDYVRNIKWRYEDLDDTHKAEVDLRVKEIYGITPEGGESK